MNMKVAMDNVPNTLGRLATAIGEAGANIMSMGGFDIKGDLLVDDIVVNCREESHAQAVLDAVNALDGIRVISWFDRTFDMHEGGKIEVLPLVSVG
ncbi:MAG: NAD-dependent malic enzyme, partial [Actinobacteria bacterium]|nr:NAD-dependent malic enzyme [Actinomycetota bacterium]